MQRFHTIRGVTNGSRLWYTKKYNSVTKPILTERGGVFTQEEQEKTRRLPDFARLAALLGLLFCAIFAATPVHAADYEGTLDQLGRLQALANEFSAAQDATPDPIVLTLAYTRVGDYNTNTWQLTAGTRDPAFEKYVAEQAPELADLQGMNTVILPNGQGIDFGHLLASMNLVYNGMPITGSWGGDCMQMAAAFQGQAGDADGYANAMAGSFALEDDGTNSLFGTHDLRADLDSVVVGSLLKKDTDIADALRSYYEELDDYSRVYQFVGLSFGSTDTGDTAAFRETVYNTMLKDTGMQLLLYMNRMWKTDGWALDEAFEPAMRGISNLFADYLATAVNHEKVKSATETRMTTMAGQALADALNALGDTDAAKAVLGKLQDESATSSTTSASDVVNQTLTGATETMQRHFDLKIFQLVLLIVAAAAVLLILISAAMLIRHLHGK